MGIYALIDDRENRLECYLLISADQLLTAEEIGAAISKESHFATRWLIEGWYSGNKANLVTLCLSQEDIRELFYGWLWAFHSSDQAIVMNSPFDIEAANQHIAPSLRPPQQNKIVKKIPLETVIRPYFSGEHDGGWQDGIIPESVKVELFLTIPRHETPEASFVESYRELKALFDDSNEGVTRAASIAFKGATLAQRMAVQNLFDGGVLEYLFANSYPAEIIIELMHNGCPVTRNFIATLEANAKDPDVKKILATRNGAWHQIA